MGAATMSRIEELKEFQALCRNVDVRDDAAFQNLLQSARHILEMSEAQIADALSVSRPTFNRWVNGRSLPHVAMRTPAISWIVDQLGKKIKLRATYSSGSFSGGRFAAKGF
jgi:hypothetical protein